MLLGALIVRKIRSLYLIAQLQFDYFPKFFRPSVNLMNYYRCRHLRSFTTVYRIIQRIVFTIWLQRAGVSYSLVISRNKPSKPSTRASRQSGKDETAAGAR